MASLAYAKGNKAVHASVCEVGVRLRKRKELSTSLLLHDVTVSSLRTVNLMEIGQSVPPTPKFWSKVCTPEIDACVLGIVGSLWPVHQTVGDSDYKCLQTTNMKPIDELLLQMINGMICQALVILPCCCIQDCRVPPIYLRAAILYALSVY